MLGLAGLFVCRLLFNCHSTQSTGCAEGQGRKATKKKAEESWTGFSTSGAHSSLPQVEIFGLVNDGLLFIRDNTTVPELLGANPDVSGIVYYETEAYGFTITGAQIYNQSYFEYMVITDVRVETFDSVQDRLIYLDIAYSNSQVSIHFPGFGIASPRSLSNIVPTSRITFYQSQYVRVIIYVQSNTGRIGQTSGILNFP